MNEQRRLELWSSLAIRHTKGIGARKSCLLVETFGSASLAVEAQKKSSSAWKGIVSEKACQNFLSEQWRETALHEWRAIQSSGTSFLLLSEPNYPTLLKNICDAPLVLYVRGDISLLHNPMIGVVGSRNCTNEGIRACILLSQALSEAGITIVSGMARGIDRAAHLAGLAGVGSSVAVLGTGVDVVYPQENKDLALHLAQKGVIVSEFSPGTMAHARNFPIRNRIISGLSLGLLVVEASERSGSLITARLSLEQDRDVFAVPGHMTAPVSEGCRGLIRKGAKPVFSVDDIFMDIAPRLAANLRERMKNIPLTSRESMLDKLSSTDLIENLPLPLYPFQEKNKEKIHSITKSSIKAHHLEKERTTIAQGLREIHALSPEEDRIVGALQQDDFSIDELALALSIEIGALGSILTSMEIKGVVNRLPGMRYSLL